MIAELPGDIADVSCPRPNGTGRVSLSVEDGLDVVDHVEQIRQFLFGVDGEFRRTLDQSTQIGTQTTDCRVGLVDDRSQIVAGDRLQSAVGGRQEIVYVRRYAGVGQADHVTVLERRTVCA